MTWSPMIALKRAEPFAMNHASKVFEATNVAFDSEWSLAGGVRCGDQIEASFISTLKPLRLDRQYDPA